MLDRQNHAAGRANDSIMVGMFVCLCLASKKPSKQEFFVPAVTDLGVKLLMRSATMLLIYIRFGLPAIFEAIIAVLGQQRCVPWPKISSNHQ